MDAEEKNDAEGFQVRLVRPYEAERGYNSRRTAWNDDRIAALKQLWKDGLTAKEIARRLGGISRNSVIGKIHRLGLAERTTSPHRRVVRPKKRRAKKPVSWRMPTRRQRTLEALAAQPLPPPELTDIPRKSFHELDEQRDCKWVVLLEAVGPWTKQYCGAERVPGMSYCADHCRRSFSSLQPVQRQPVEPAPTFETFVKEFS